MSSSRRRHQASGSAHDIAYNYNFATLEKSASFPALRPPKPKPSTSQQQTMPAPSFSGIHTEEKAKQACDSTNYIVRLNIGGHMYSTTSSTLTAMGDNFFTGLLSKRMPTILDTTGAYFVDRYGLCPLMYH